MRGDGGSIRTFFFGVTHQKKKKKIKNTLAFFSLLEAQMGYALIYGKLGSSVVAEKSVDPLFLANLDEISTRPFLSITRRVRLTRWSADPAL